MGKCCHAGTTPPSRCPRKPLPSCCNSSVSQEAPMERMKASDFPPEVLKLFDGFVHGRITRRDFLDRAAKYAITGFSATAMLEALTPNFAWAQQVKPDDARIKVGYTDYLAPKGSGKM